MHIPCLICATLGFTLDLRDHASHTPCKTGIRPPACRSAPLRCVLLQLRLERLQSPLKVCTRPLINKHLFLVVMPGLDPHISARVPSLQVDSLKRLSLRQCDRPSCIPIVGIADGLKPCSQQFICQSFERNLVQKIVRPLLATSHVSHCAL